MGAPPAPPPGYRIRPRREQEDALLVAIENRAAELFRTHGYPDIADNPFSGVADFRAMIGTNRVWVATTTADDPVGFAVAGPLAGYIHLRELAVDPAHGQRGIGAALVGSVVAAAQDEGAMGVSLTTFRLVPFNRPFYEKLGFRELPLAEAPILLREIFRNELPPGTGARERLLMVFPSPDST